MAVGDCSVTERRRWRPPYQIVKTVHVHAKHYKHNEDGRTAPGVCGNGSIPLSLSGTSLRELEYTHMTDELKISQFLPQEMRQIGAENDNCWFKQYFIQMSCNTKIHGTGSDRKLELI